MNLRTTLQHDLFSFLTQDEVEIETVLEYASRIPREQFSTVAETALQLMHHAHRERLDLIGEVVDASSLQFITPADLLIYTSYLAQYSASSVEKRIQKDYPDIHFEQGAVIDPAIARTNWRLHERCLLVLAEPDYSATIVHLPALAKLCQTSSAASMFFDDLKKAYIADGRRMENGEDLALRPGSDEARFIDTLTFLPKEIRDRLCLPVAFEERSTLFNQLITALIGLISLKIEDLLTVVEDAKLNVLVYFRDLIEEDFFADLQATKLVKKATGHPRAELVNWLFNRWKPEQVLQGVCAQETVAYFHTLPLPVQQQFGEVLVNFIFRDIDALAIVDEEVWEAAISFLMSAHGEANVSRIIDELIASGSYSDEEKHLLSGLLRQFHSVYEHISVPTNSNAI